MSVSLKTINNLKQFQDFLGNDPKMEYVAGKGRKFNHSYSLNQISYQFKKCIPENPDEGDQAQIQNIKAKLYQLDKPSMTSLAKQANATPFEIICAKIRRAIGNWWFKVTTGFDRQAFLTPPPPVAEEPVEVTNAFDRQAVLTPPVSEGAVEALMTKFTNAYNKENGTFNFPPFDLEQFTKMLIDHADRFTKDGIDPSKHFGYIEKFDLKPEENPQIFMRADLHGDLKSLIEDLKSLQEQGHLDQNFKCKPGVHLQFLGDYVDRGFYGTQILELLLRLKEENPTQVHLIRGNHEYTEVSRMYCYPDAYLTQAQNDETCRKALERFYETMPLTTYFSVSGEEKREYVQCTHGTFEPTMDPALLLNSGISGDYVAVPRERKLSERIKKIAEGNSELAVAAKRIAEIAKKSIAMEEELSVYNWGDVTEGETNLGSLGARNYCLSGKDIRHYLDISSDQHRVVMLFRGHQHEFQHVKDHKGQVVATTLPVGMDSPYKERFDQPDRAYIITPKAKVADWQKRAILRKTGHDKVDEVTKAYPLTSDAV